MKKHNSFHQLIVILSIVIKNIISASVWILIGLAGLLIFLFRKDFIGIVIGLPLLLIGVGFIINSFWTVIISIFSKTYNKAVCVLCNLQKIPNKK